MKETLKNKYKGWLGELGSLINQAYNSGLIRSNYSNIRKEMKISFPEEYIDEEGYFDEDFIDALNTEQRDFILKRKTMWNRICSCRDWLQVAEHNLKQPKFNYESQDKSSMNLITFISNCELLISSIESLWEAISSDMGIEKFDFCSRSIFNSNEFGKEHDDRYHFKLLRAWFGVHGVDGYERKVKITLNKEEEVEVKSKFFSSYSSFHTKNPSIILYSEIDEAEKKYGGVKEFEIDKVIQLVNFYYDSLEILIERIRKKLPEEERDFSTPIHPIFKRKKSKFEEDLDYTLLCVLKERIPSSWFLEWKIFTKQ